MARVPFLVSLNLCRFSPSHRNRPGTTDAGAIATGGCYLSGRDAYRAGGPARRQGRDPLRLKGWRRHNERRRGIQLAREGGAFSVCPARLASHTGTILEKWEIKTHTEEEGKAILPDVAASLKEKKAEHDLADADIIGVGVGVPAPVTEEGIVFGSANLGWKYKEVKKELEELTGLDVEVGNDANVAALGEMWKGGGAGYKNLIMVTLGTGVGGGIIVGGKILTGSHGAGGEIGHLRVNPHETESCGCGGKGCLEQYASATGIVRLAKRKLEQETRNTILNRNDLSAKSVFDAVKADDSVAKEIAESFGNYLGRALANLAAVIDPSIFVIGGGVSKAGEILLEYVEKPFQENAFFANKDVRFALATLGNDAGICGAAKLVLDDFAE